VNLTPRRIAAAAYGRTCIVYVSLQLNECYLRLDGQRLELFRHDQSVIRNFCLALKDGERLCNTLEAEHIVSICSNLDFEHRTLDNAIDNDGVLRGLK
jgi:hypothetical protein